MNKARLEFHREKQRSLTEYIRNKNAAAMAEWLEGQRGVDRDAPDQLLALAELRETQGVKLLHAVTVLDTERREGALKRAGRLLRDADALKARAARLRNGENPLDEWATCRCGAAFQPGERSYATCWACSSREYYKSSYACVYCDRRHSMSFAACFVCKADGREDAARDLRLVVHRRDNYTCAMCGVDAMETGAELQVSHIKPCELGGTSDPWNLETLCGTCQAIRGSKNYEKLDEREFWRMVREYAGPLFEYLAIDERARLLALEPDTEREQIDFGHPAPWPDLGECAEQDGVMNALALGAKPISVQSHNSAISDGPDACKGEVWLGTGKRDCRNTTDYREGILCATSCR